MEATVPLMYVPLIMYASWMDFMTRSFVVVRDRRDDPIDEAQRVGPRTRA